jgi:hypothetical protein
MFKMFEQRPVHPEVNTKTYRSRSQILVKDITVFIEIGSSENGNKHRRKLQNNCIRLKPENDALIILTQSTFTLAKYIITPLGSDSTVMLLNCLRGTGGWDSR